MQVVIDTNVLVSSLWSKEGNPAQIMALVLNGEINVCYDARILAEYHEVLRRPVFRFERSEIDSLLTIIEKYGFSVVPMPLGISLPDETDKMFLETADAVSGILITGNAKHFPQRENIVSPTEFLERYRRAERRRD